MRTHPLDRAFKKGLKGNSAAVPAGTWEAIQANLPAPKNSGRAIPYWLIGSALVVAIIMALVLWPDSSTQNNESTPPEGSNVQQALALTPDLNETNDLTKEQEATETANANTSSEENDPEAESITTSNELATANSTSVKSSGLAAVASEVSPSIQAEPTYDVDNKSSQQSSTAANLPADAGDLETGADVLETNPLSGLEMHDNESTERHDGIGIAPIDPLNTGVTYETEIGLKVTDCYAFDKKSAGRFLLEVYTGPSFSLKNLSSKGENVDDYISARDSTESSQLSWHAGLRVGYEHSSGLTGRAGVHYTLVNEVFKDVSRYERIIIETIFDSNGNPIGFDTTLETGTRTKQTQNRYHAIDIPLLIGYRIDNGNWDLGIQAGPVFNIAFNTKGDMIDPATGLVGSFSDESAMDYHPVFKDKIGMSIYAGFYASKRIGNNLWAFVEPHFQYRLKSITLDSYPVDQKQTNIGLSIGVRLKL
ncbi:MAG: hypothetical protein DRI69_00165 [Bacteroidetes bacterium]|nr:MAG: hypothetical protein DRI69_00165 [Bacteroidota bacterium]